MREEGFDHGEAGVRQFAEVYGVLEKVTTIEAAENACSKAKVTTTIKRQAGRISAALWRIPDELGRVRVAGRHLGCAASLP